MGAGDDTVAFVPPDLTFAAPCVPGQNPVTPVSMTLGAGDDRVTTVPPTCGVGSILDPTQTDASRPAELAPRFTSLDGGPGNDRIQGGSFGDALSGGTGNDSIDGGEGNDDIVGGTAGDHITGSSAPETLQGRGGDDTITAVDGVKDVVSCGDGDDVATLDLKDAATLHFVTLTVLGQQRQVLVPDCERVTRQAVDDSPPGRLASRALRLAGGTASVRFRCPASARPRCRGTLVVRDARRGGRVLGRTAYDVALGRSATLGVPLRPGAAAALRRTRVAAVATVERGHSRIGSRRAATVVRVRG